MLEPDEDETALLEEGHRCYRKRDYEAAFRIFLELADKGWEEVQDYLGVMYALGDGTKKNDQKAEYWLRLASERGEPRAQWWLACMLGRKGKVEEMVELFEKAAAQDFAPAIFRLARCYYHGKGVTRDKQKYVELMDEAAKKGNLWAQGAYARQLMIGAEGVSGIVRGIRLLADAWLTAYKIARKDKRNVRLQG